MAQTHKSKGPVSDFMRYGLNKTGGGKTLGATASAKKAKAADYQKAQDKAFVGMKKAK